MTSSSTLSPSRASWRAPLVLTVALAVSVVGCASSGAPGSGPPDVPDHVLRAADRLPLEPCAVGEGETKTALCGTLAVPENREDTGSRTIDLAVVVVPATVAEPEPDALVFLAGGPGGSVTDGAPFLDQMLPERSRDILLVDQRGTGRSNPLLCQLQGRDGDLASFYGDMWPPAEVERCRRELEAAGNDLAAYTTAAFADDLDAVRAWLGYEELTLSGGSYGTRSAQEYMRRHPEHVRAAVLQGVVPFDSHMPIDHAPAARRAVELMFEACRADVACHRAFPDLAGDWRRALEQLDREPARVTIDHPETGEPVTVTIGRQVFGESIRSLLYIPARAADFPYIVHQAAAGNLEPFVKATLPGKMGLSQYLADGLYLSVSCAEDVPFIDRDRAARMAEGSAMGLYRVDQQVRACQLWPRAEVDPEIIHAPLETEIPVLLVSGNVDPVTPPANGEMVAARMPNSLHVVIPNGHHDVAGLANEECLLDLVQEFIEQGSVEGLETSCVATMTRPPFAVEASMLGYMQEGGVGLPVPGTEDDEDAGADG